MADDSDETGLGGWLAFFVFAMAGLTPVAMVYSTWTALYGDESVGFAAMDYWTTLQVFEWSLAAVVIAGCWFIAARLAWVQVWRSVQITIAGIWILGLGSLLVDFVGVSMITGIPLALLASGLGPEVVRPLIFGAIWTAYFLRSKRVANTYRRDGDPEEVAQVFG
jgi:Protein of unknown function (DUF2569)